MFVFFFKQKTAYEMRISDWSSDVCSSDLPILSRRQDRQVPHALELPRVCDAARRDSVPRRRLAQQSRPRRAGLMRYRLPGQSGLRVAQVALGTTTFGTAADWSRPAEGGRPVFDAFAEARGSFISTASIARNCSASGKRVEVG